jgi:hypothetical protein
LALGESTVAFSARTFGDQFSRGVRASTTIRLLQPGSLDGRTGRVRINNLRFNAGDYENTDLTNTRTSVPVTVSIDGIGAAPSFNTTDEIDQTGPPSTPDADVLALVRGYVAGPGAAFAALIESQANPNAQLVGFGLGDPVAGAVETQPGASIPTQYTLDYSGPLFSTVRVPVAIHVPSPSDGGVVGRVKVADDQSPLPRDRLILNYDYFDGARLTERGLPVNRYIVGFEKTFFDGSASAEVRVPFADTLNSTLTVGSDDRSAELGNVLTTLKYVVFQDDDNVASIGLAVSLPTADGIHVRRRDGSDVLSIPNHSIGLTPFVGVMHLPNDRTFIQAYAAISFDSNGTAVHVDPVLTGLGSSRIGSIRDADLLQLDVQLGYWLINEPAGFLRRFAPFVELHSNEEIGDSEIASTGDLFIGNLAGRLHELNMSAGFLSQLGDDFLLTTGIVVPLKGGDDRAFDYQVGVRANWFFGAADRRGRRPSTISSF